MDKAFVELDDYECYFLLNSEVRLGRNGAGNLGKSTPLAANYPACDIEQPSGENYTVGEYYSAITNELYSWVYNSNGVHFIQRINGNGKCEIVYYGCLPLSAEPRHSIEQWRAYLEVSKESCNNRHGKYLVWVNGQGTIYRLDVEASIATNNFTTPFFDFCGDECDFIKLCVPDPCDCLKGEFVPLKDSERGMSNKILDAGFKFAYRFIYYDDRASIWSEPSTLYYQSTKGCFANSTGFPRCIKLRVPVGNPMVIGIELAYQKDGIWKSYELIEKYSKYTSAQQYWYERKLSEIITGNNYSEEDCSFDYYFCGDKNCEVIDQAEINRESNFTPRDPQGILPISGALGFYNYVQGNCHIDKFEADKFKFGLTYPSGNCENEYCEITVRAFIHNTEHNRNQFIYRTGGGDDNAPDDPTDTAWFGGLNPALDGGLETGYEQSFREKTRNFIAYIDGTEYWGEMKQWKSHANFVDREWWGVVANLDNNGSKNRWRRATRNGEFFYQEAKIKVPRGTRGFLRLASHQQTTGVGSSQNTSTFVVDTITDIRTYNGSKDYGTMAKSGTEEIYFDTCDKSTLEIFEAFIVLDNAVDTGLSKKASAYHGYITDKNGLPIEGALIEYNSGVRCKTDHNGFYHFYVNPGENDGIDVLIKVEQDCFNFTTIATVSIQSGAGINTKFDYKVDNATYANGFYSKVNVPVVDCNGSPVGGIIVAVSGSKSKETGADGVARLRIRNYNSRDRSVRVVVMNSNGCISHTCSNGCNNCMPNYVTATSPCYQSIPVISIPNLVINAVSQNELRGLKSGGRYPVGFVIKGDCGRLSAVNERGFLDIKKTQEKDRQSFPTVTFDATGINLPTWGKCLHIVRGENVNQFELQWVVDKVERTTNGNIKLTIQSLNDYNANYFFKSNTVYKWLKNDRVEFIKNGDGKIFSASQYGILNYLTISPFNDDQTDNTAADFFNQLIIQDDGKLSNLTEGAIIELQRDKECQTEPTYFTICASIPIVNGKLMYETGVFNTFDTYIVNRTIGTFPSQQYEHHSPSDFWGERVSDIGRPYFVNKYENEKRFGRNITLNAPQQSNFFGDFVKTFDCPEHGDIISMGIYDNAVILAIGEKDNFLSQAANDILKISADGTVRAKSANEVISNADPKLSGKYGCSYDQIGSIYYGDGYVTWADGNNHCYVKHDFKTADAVDLGKVRTFFKRRLQQMQNHNRQQTNPLNKFRLCTGFNGQSEVVYLTIKTLRDSAVNNEKQAFARPNETIIFEPSSNDFLGFASFTPEGYGRLDLSDGNGCMFITFFNGLPFIHPVLPVKWNEFYGVAVDRVFGTTLNKTPTKRKNALSIEIHDETMWFVHNVSTEKSTFRSEIPPRRWARKRNKWNAAFLNNINGRGGLYGMDSAVAGEQTSGEYINVLFVRDNTDGLKYNTIDNAKRIAYDELGSVLFKYSISEQSGFTENL